MLVVQFLDTLPLLRGGLARNYILRGGYQELVELLVARIHVSRLLSGFFRLYDKTMCPGSVIPGRPKWRMYDVRHQRQQGIKRYFQRGLGIHSTRNRYVSEPRVLILVLLSRAGNKLVYVLATRAARTAKRDLPDVTRDRCGAELGEPFSSCSEVVVWKVRPPRRERSPKCGTIPEQRGGEERTKHGTRLHWNNGDHKTLALLSVTPGSRGSSNRKAQAHARRSDRTGAGHMDGSEAVKGLKDSA